MTNTETRTPQAQLVVLDDDQAVLDYAHALADADQPIGVVSSGYRLVIPFLIGNAGHTVALVADPDDPAQLAAAIARVEERLGRVSAVIRTAADIPTSGLVPAA
ncbi:MAG: hypothetical protein QM774_09440 [Gordonia sp. (in: high G+C Gram-positive bacteria)]|uniref:hypothetical protein n=1 Tax=Gordonia sp. (in: high G+C Gram-positive bacteria) TaxID=84139 RepID=UPI0039E376F0